MIEFTTDQVIFAMSDPDDFGSALLACRVDLDRKARPELLGLLMNCASEFAVLRDARVSVSIERCGCVTVTLNERGPFIKRCAGDPDKLSYGQVREFVLKMFAALDSGYRPAIALGQDQH